MANGRRDDDAPGRGRGGRGGPVPNEDGLRALGHNIEGGRARPVANEAGLRALGDAVDRGGRGGGGRRHWSRRRKVLSVLAALALLVVVVAGGSYGYLRYRYDQVPKADIPAETAQISGQPFNMLVLGSDSRVGESSSAFGSASVVTGQRSDVIMIWHVDPGTHQISIVSIPRDTLVTMVGDQSDLGSKNRINSAYDQGPNLLVQTIQDNFGIPINHVVQVDFAGFQGAVNALGGVWMNFPYPAKDVWSGLDITTPGCQLLNGAQALAVARSRHYQYEVDGSWQYDGSSDFGRIQRQDAFLRALIDAAKSKENPFTINAFLGSLPQGLVIDKNLGLNEVLGLVAAFHGFPASALVSQTLPTTSIGYVSPWGDVLFVDQPAAQEMLVSVFGSQLTTPTNPPPNTSLQPQPPPVVTTTTAPPATTAPHPAATAPPTTAPAAAANPSFDPVPCSHH
jgi:LCP family protein required for cell wall assembly